MIVLNTGRPEAPHSWGFLFVTKKKKIKAIKAKEKPVKEKLDDKIRFEDLAKKIENKSRELKDDPSEVLIIEKDKNEVSRTSKTVLEKKRNK